MTNTTTNTNKSIFLALSVAMTMGAANATNVPGIPGNVFEFSKPGVTDGAVVAGTGVDAIANINAILTAVGTTGGNALSQANFWGSSVDKQDVDVFEYDNAAPMIEELIFTVKGEFLNANSGNWEVATGNDLTRMKSRVSNVTALNSNNELADGSYLNGKLSHTKAMAFDLLTMLKYNYTDRSTADDGTTATDITSTVTFTGPHSLIEKSVIVNESTGGLKEAVNAASLNKVAFQNANHLVALIANELKTGYILNVEKATANLAKIADHHTGMLSATLVQQAAGIKAVIKNIGYLEASTGLGKATNGACVVGTVTDKKATACTTIGGKFVTLSQSLTSVAGAGTLADEYATDLANIVAFADNIISFNNTVGAFDATAEAGKITAEFGTITVKKDTTAGSLYENLEAGTAPTEASITGIALDTSVTIEDYTLDGGTGSIVTGLDLDNDSVFDIVFDAPVVATPAVVTPAVTTPLGN